MRRCRRCWTILPSSRSTNRFDAIIWVYVLGSHDFSRGRITSKEGEGHSGIVLLQAAESSGRIDTVVSLMYISV